MWPKYQPSFLLQHAVNDAGGVPKECHKRVVNKSLVWNAIKTSKSLHVTGKARQGRKIIKRIAKYGSNLRKSDGFDAAERTAQHSK